MKNFITIAGAVLALHGGAASAQVTLQSDTKQHWYAMIDTLGRFFPLAKYERFRSFHNGFAAAGPGSLRRDWIDVNGKELTNAKYWEISDFNDQGFAMARGHDGPAIVVDRTGREIRRVEAPSSGMMRRRPPIFGLLERSPYAITGSFLQRGLIDVNGKVLFP